MTLDMIASVIAGTAKPGNNGAVSCSTPLPPPPPTIPVAMHLQECKMPLDMIASVIAGTAKPGNNGAVSCSTYCKGMQWGPTYSSCSAAWDLSAQRAIDCNTVRGVAAPEVLCYCNGLTGVCVGGGEKRRSLKGLGQFLGSFRVFFEGFA